MKIPFHEVLQIYDLHQAALKKEKEDEKNNQEKMKASMPKAKKP